jgi:hypothetical protein
VRCRSTSTESDLHLPSRIRRGELRLPETQRRYVWRSTRVRDCRPALKSVLPHFSVQRSSCLRDIPGQLSFFLNSYNIPQKQQRGRVSVTKWPVACGDERRQAIDDQEREAPQFVPSRVVAAHAYTCLPGSAIGSFGRGRCSGRGREGKRSWPGSPFGN